MATNPNNIPEALRRQPTNDNQFAAGNFRFTIPRAPIFTYNIQATNMPALVFDDIEQPVVDFVSVKLPGSSFDYQQLTVRATMDEDWHAWAEIYFWMRSMGNHTDHTEYRAERGRSVKNTLANQLEQATLHILTASGKENLKIDFIDLFPVSLGGFEMDSAIAETAPVTFEVTFSYTNIFVTKLGAPAGFELWPFPRTTPPQEAGQVTDVEGPFPRNIALPGADPACPAEDPDPTP